jgi:hypothetical protein
MQRSLLFLVALALLFGGVGQATAGPITFDFQFDNAGIDPNRPDGTIIPPLVGSGTFTINNDPGLGTFTLASLGAFTMSFTFNDGNSFTQADIATNNSITTAVITSSGTGERVVFSDGGSGGGGPFNGSLDLVNAGGAFLTFEPSFLVPPPPSPGGLDLYLENGNLQGDYLALTPSVAATPEPSSLTLLGLGSLGLLGYGWRRRKQVA